MRRRSVVFARSSDWGDGVGDWRIRFGMWIRREMSARPGKL